MAEAASSFLLHDAPTNYTAAFRPYIFSRRRSIALLRAPGNEGAAKMKERGTVLFLVYSFRSSRTHLHPVPISSGLNCDAELDAARVGVSGKQMNKQARKQAGVFPSFNLMR